MTLKLHYYRLGVSLGILIHLVNRKRGKRTLGKSFINKTVSNKSIPTVVQVNWLIAQKTVNIMIPIAVKKLLGK